MDCGCERVEMEKEKAKIWIPVDADISQFEMGGDIEVVIKGKIKGGNFHLDKEEWRESKGELTIEVDSVSVEGTNVFGSMVE